MPSCFLIRSNNNVTARVYISHIPDNEGKFELRPCYTVEFFLQLETHFDFWEMLISGDCRSYGECVSKLWWKRVFANFTSFKSRNAVQVARKMRLRETKSRFLPVIYNMCEFFLQHTSPLKISIFCIQAQLFYLIRLLFDEISRLISWYPTKMRLTVFQFTYLFKKSFWYSIIFEIILVTA